MALRIAEVAERTGVPATTLRYYEDIGLLAPAGRSGNGYRAYSERDVERLRFLTRARQLDISLGDLRELVVAWDGDDCEGVQERMAQVVAARLSQTQARVAELMELAAQLRSAATRLAGPHRPGACDENCACSTAHSVPLPAIACSLDPGATRDRISDWRAVLAGATSHSPIPGGQSFSFEHDANVTGALARLAAAEQACCPFFDFAIFIGATGVRFEVRAPDEARDVLAALLGDAA